MDFEKKEISAVQNSYNITKALAECQTNAKNHNLIHDLLSDNLALCSCSFSLPIWEVGYNGYKLFDGAFDIGRAILGIGKFI